MVRIPANNDKGGKKRVKKLETVVLNTTWLNSVKARAGPKKAIIMDSVALSIRPLHSSQKPDTC